jgi:hypothetical protein
LPQPSRPSIIAAGQQNPDGGVDVLGAAQVA